MMAAVALAYGLVFGFVAVCLMRSQGVDGWLFGVGWLVVHLLSGTWLWAVVTTFVSCRLISQSKLKSWRRYIWALILAWLFLIATTAMWYAQVSGIRILTQIPFVMAVNLPIAAGIGLVAAFINRHDWLGLAARLCFAVGLIVVLINAAPPSHLELTSSESAKILTVWWSQIAISIVMAVYFVVSWTKQRQQKV